MSFYPPAINARFSRPDNAGSIEDSSTEATDASFECGASVSISLQIDSAATTITRARFRTNGCGYMTAAADLLCEWLSGKQLGDLHGLQDRELEPVISSDLGAYPGSRRQCATVVFQALRNALARYRRARIAEFQGDEALICTCFGVTEETLVEAVARRGMGDLDEVMRATRAGTGCGSCRLLIQEIIDAHCP